MIVVFPNHTHVFGVSCTMRNDGTGQTYKRRIANMYASLLLVLIVCFAPIACSEFVTDSGLVV